MYEVLFGAAIGGLIGSIVVWFLGNWKLKQRIDAIERQISRLNVRLGQTQGQQPWYVNLIGGMLSNPQIQQGLAQFLTKITPKQEQQILEVE
jgi:membrane protein YqaA with SNARE-associated domain